MSILEAHGLRKVYGPTVALADAALTREQGVVHGVIGENGAGKLTLTRILAGLVKPDEGELRFDGQFLTKSSVQESLGLGIAFAY